VGKDSYYGVEVYAYETGDKAVLSVKVRNDEPFSINVTRVYVSFDWGLDYNSTEVNATNPLTLEPFETRPFFIEFQVPYISIASNLYTHSYTIVAMYSYPNATDPTKTITEYYEFYADDFAVYSTDQAEAINLNRTIQKYFPQTPTTWYSARAQILWNKAWKEINSGNEYYRQGDFSASRQHYTAALDYIDQAWLAEETYLTTQEELQVQETQATIKTLEAMANFFNGLSTMWNLFGIGAILFGIGYILKWLTHMRIKKTET
jgi:tetratricopeptide (TPR) repeat protein